MKGQVLHIFNILKNSISRILNIEICKTGNSIIINFGMTHLIVHNQIPPTFFHYRHFMNALCKYQL